MQEETRSYGDDADNQKGERQGKVDRDLNAFKMQILPFQGKNDVKTYLE